MKGYDVYSKIHQLREAGLSQRQTAQQLGINRKTVKRYWEMPVKEYERVCRAVRRETQLDEYREQIVSWLKEYPTLTAAQVSDWLKEHYQTEFKDRTVSRYVRRMREEYGLKKAAHSREYEAVPELPMGKQMQVDFGQLELRNTAQGKTKVYAAAFVLSRSRYKYAYLQSRPFTSADLVRICHDCFEYMGGIPEEMVFDQDSIVCVSENAGDIIFTYEFEKFRQESKVRIHLCRKADPESKGKIENVVKYVKGNFLENRLYVDDESLNRSCLAWLERTANAKVHGTTKLIPAEVFKEEQNFLRPLPVCSPAEPQKICRVVRKDNTICYGSNRYSVPLGTYNTQPEVQIEELNGVLYIRTLSGESICEHRVSLGKGRLIQNKNHLRDRTTALNKLMEDLNADLNHRALDFLKTIRTQKSRYARDQFALIRSLLVQYGTEAVLRAVAFCETGKLYSANLMRDYLEHTAVPLDRAEPVPAVIPVDDPKYHVTTQKRSLAEYAKVGGSL